MALFTPSRGSGRSSSGTFQTKKGKLVGGARGASKGESKRAKTAKIAKFKATRGM